MKAVQLEIALSGRNKKISRTLLLPKKYTYVQLHEIIQLLFGLDHCESYFFEKNNKLIEDTDKTLIRLSLKDSIMYHYDIVDHLVFHVKPIAFLECEVPKCVEYHGKNLYEASSQEIVNKYQSSFEMEYVNQCLSMFETSHHDFLNQVQEIVKELISIRFFQDYTHNQIVKIIHHNREVYMGCDASEDVIINFHINGNKLVEYTSVRPAAIVQSIIKYHDCIELTLMKKNEQEEFDFTVGNFGCFLSYASVVHDENIPSFFKMIYLDALRQYVKAIAHCAKENIKFQYGKMIEINDQDEVREMDGKLNIYHFELLSSHFIQQLKDQFDKNDQTIQADVLSLLDDDGQVKTLAIVGNKDSGFDTEVLSNVSLKTMSYILVNMLIERWERVGKDSCIEMRDGSLWNVLEKIMKEFDVSCELVDRLDEIDDAFLPKKEEIDPLSLDPKEMILRLLEELGVDIKDLDHIEIKKSDLKDLIQNDEKKYS